MEPIKVIKIIIIKDEFKVSITIHFGKNPRRGGTPPKDIISKNNLKVRGRDINESLVEIIWEEEEENHNKSIRGMVVKI